MQGNSQTLYTEIGSPFAKCGTNLNKKENVKWI
nr:MAG TPA: hypothetical protein [Caudoviricetes sp.]